MEPTSNDPSIAAAPLDNLSAMISALAGATDAAGRRMYLRGVAQALEFIVGRTHEAIIGLVAALAKEGRS